MLRLVGVLDRAGAHELRRRLLKVMAPQPVAVVCDLDGVEAADSTSATVFPTAWREAGGWPSISLSLCSPNRAVASRLNAVGMPRFLAIHPTLEEAIEAVHALPPYLSRSTGLRYDVLASRDGRVFAGQAWRDWRLGASVEDALLVLTEMVANSIRHGAPPVRLSLRLRRDRLRIAVSDGGEGRPRPRLRPVCADTSTDSVALAEGGRGLRLVASLSDAWGVSETHDGPGKTVWSELRICHA